MCDFLFCCTIEVSLYICTSTKSSVKTCVATWLMLLIFTLIPCADLYNEWASIKIEDTELISMTVVPQLGVGINVTRIWLCTYIEITIVFVRKHSFTKFSGTPK